MSPLVRSAPRRFAGMVLTGALTTSALVLLPAASASAATAQPSGVPTGTIRTSPFQNSSIKMGDNEGSAYVERDHALWLAQDVRRLFEVDADTGDLRRTVNSTDFAAVPHVGGTGPLAGEQRTSSDIESLAYDKTNDILYVFSGENQAGFDIPAVFRMTRQGGSLKLQDYQLLPAGSDFTAAAWNPADGKVYVGYKSVLQTYDFATNTVGPTFGVGVARIYGMDFSPDGQELFLSRTNVDSTPRQAEVVKVDWATKKEAWRIDVLPAGVRDARAVAYVDGALYVSDGFDDGADPPTEHAVYIFGQRQSTPVVDAKFTATPVTGGAPLDVTFQDASTGSPTRWAWDFGDGSKSAAQNPTHTYAKPGTYHVTLTASSLTRSDQATATIEVEDVVAPTATYAVPSGKIWAGWTKVTLTEAGLHDDVTPAAQIRRSVAWGDGTTTTGLTHVYSKAGSYAAKVTLTDQAGNAATIDAGTVVVRADTAAPVVNLKRPRNLASVAAWRTLRGTAVDATTGVRDVRLRIIEKRGARWYAYRGTNRTWVAARTRVAALRLSRPAVVAPRTTAWAYSLPGLRTGYLVITVTGRDMVGNTAAAKTYAQRITRR